MLRDKVQRRGVLPHGEVRQLRVAGGVREQVRERRLGGGEEPVQVPPEARGRVHVHLDEVLVETIAASAPAAGGSDKEAGGDVDVAAEQPGERLPDGGRGLRREEVGFSALREARVLGVAGDVAEAGPLEDEGAGGGEAVGGGVCGARGVEAEDVVGDTGGGVEGDLEVVGEADGLLEDGLDGGGRVAGGCLRFEGAREEVVGWGGALARFDVDVWGGVPEINPPRYRIVVSNSETSSSVLSKSMVFTCSRMTSTISHLPMISAVLRASMAVAPHPFLATCQPLFSSCNQVRADWNGQTDHHIPPPSPASTSPAGRHACSTHPTTSGIPASQPRLGPCAPGILVVLGRSGGLRREAVRLVGAEWGCCWGMYGCWLGMDGCWLGTGGHCWDMGLAAGCHRCRVFRGRTGARAHSFRRRVTEVRRC